MPTKFGVYSLFVPEFIEAQRTSFLRLLKTGIPTELEKHNPIELAFKKTKKKAPSILPRPPFNLREKRRQERLDYKKTLLETSLVSLTSRIRLNDTCADEVAILDTYLSPRNFLLNQFKTPQKRLKKKANLSYRSDFKEIPQFLNPTGLENSLGDLYSVNATIPQIARHGGKSPFKRPFSIYFRPSTFKLLPPQDTAKSCLSNAKTYSASMFVAADLKTLNGTILLSQWLFLGNVPLITNRGHFIINGTPRVILHQLVRSPGVYYYKSKNKPTYYADIICHRGVWLRIETDKKGLIWARMKTMPKIPIVSFLQAFGLDHPHFLAQLEDNTFLPDPPKENDKIIRVNTIAREIFRSNRYARLALDLVIVDKKRAKFADTFLHNLKVSLRFLKLKFSARYYDLSEIGRRQVNRQLGLRKSLETQILTLDDFICIVNKLIQVQDGFVPLDDIDNLKNRRVRCSGELIQNQFGIGLINIQKLASKKEYEFAEFLKLKLIKKMITTKPINGAFKEFFNSSPLSQFLDQTNCLAELTHKRRLSSLGPGGITRETAGMKIRSIHPSHYGRICPIETPEGPNAGLVNSLTTYARINPTGFIETPFYKVLNGQIENTDQVFYFLAQHDEMHTIAPPDLKLTGLSVLQSQTIPIRLGSEFSKVTRENVDFMSVSRIQLISVATSLIPFLEHNDANRALMGSNMQRQSVPLVRPERAIVGTGLEGRVVSDSGHTIQARESGFVTYATSEKIQVLSFFKLGYKSLHYASKNKKQLGVFDNEFEAAILTYHLQQFTRSNQNTAFVQRPLVHEGQWVLKGACLADCASSSFGELAIGKNVLVAYLPWEGYNFEDAILVSERLIFDDLFTSIHVIRYRTEIRETKFGLEKITREKIDNDPTETQNPKLKEQFSQLDSNGIIKLGSWVSEGDILVRKIAPVAKKELSAFQKFLYVIVDKPLPESKDTSLRVAKGLEGRVIDIKIRKTKNLLETDPIGPEAVTIWIAEKKWLQMGDKMAGRHGNKGIVSRILPRQDMPYLPDGTPIDIVLNPLGVPSRMNVGQLYESLLGLAGKHLNQNYKVMPFDEISGPQASRSLTFSKLYEARKKTGKKWLFQPETPGKMRIFDGRTGEAFDQSITVGEAYMLKLIHLVDEKIHARSTGPYSLVTQQPLRGRSKRGGQRFGEMEVWALEGFGAAYTLQEILTIKSDDLHGRQQVISALTEGKEIQIGKPESFRVLIRELQALCLNVNVFDYPIVSRPIYPTDFKFFQTKKTLQKLRHVGKRRPPINLDTFEFNQQ